MYPTKAQEYLAVSNQSFPKITNGHSIDSLSSTASSRKGRVEPANVRLAESRNERNPNGKFHSINVFMPVFFNCNGFVQIIYVHVNYIDRVLFLLSFLHVLYTIKLINGFPINFL